MSVGLLRLLHAVKHARDDKILVRAHLDILRPGYPVKTNWTTSIVPKASHRLHATYAREGIVSGGERAEHSSVGVERRFAMAASNPAKLFMTALLIMPIACFAQSGGSGVK